MAAKPLPATYVSVEVSSDKEVGDMELAEDFLSGALTDVMENREEGREEGREEAGEEGREETDASQEATFLYLLKTNIFLG